MIRLNDKDYNEIAAKLLAAIGGSEFYNGSVEYCAPDYDSVLTSTLIIYRQPLLDPADPAGSASRISDIVPVWWEFHTCDTFGEQLNGFSWSELKTYLI